MASSSSGVARRKHVTTACVSCRESKVKCDGISPACSNCKNRGKACRYQAGDDKRKLSLRIAIELLLARVSQLSEFISENGLPLPSMDPESEAVLLRSLSSLRLAHALPGRRTGETPDSHTGALAHQPPRPPTAATAATATATRAPEGTVKSADAPKAPETAGNSTCACHSTDTVGTDTVDTAALSGPLEPTRTARPRLSRLDTLDPALTIDLNDSYVPHFADDHSYPLSSAPALPPDVIGDWLSFNGADLVGSLPLPPPPPTASNRLPLSAPGVQHIRTVRVPGVAGVADSPDPASDSDSTEELIDQLSDRMGSLQIGPRGHIRYYGATSNFNLVDMPAPDNLTVHRTVRHDGQDHLNSLGLGKPVPADLEDHLVRLYFAWQDPACHVVDRALYEDAKRTWHDHQQDTPYFSEALRNAMCALGAAFAPRHHPTFVTFPQSLSDFFADRAKALLEIEMDSPCVATVQALAVLSGHDIGCRRDARGWLYSGMGLRLAFDLALHVDMSAYVAAGVLSAAECRLRRTVFWGAYVADHLLGFYLGRSIRTNMEDVTVAKPGSDGATNAITTDTWLPYGCPRMDSAGGGGGGPSNSSTDLGLQVATDELSKHRATLCEIGGPMGHMLYGNPSIPPAALQTINEKTVARMEAWKRDLPPELQVDVDDHTQMCSPHVLMLHMQYNQIMIHAHRPWMSRTYVQPVPPQGPGFWHARQMCIDRAVDLAKLLQLYEQRYTFRRMNVQGVGMACSSALLLLFAVMTNFHAPKPEQQSSDHARPGETDPRSRAQIPPPPPLSSSPSSSVTSSSSSSSAASSLPPPSSSPALLGQHLNTCFRALDELALSWEAAKRAHEFLILLQRQWEKRRRRGGSGGTGGSGAADTTSGAGPGTKSGPHSGSRESRGSRCGRSDSRTRHASWADHTAPRKKRVRTLSRSGPPRQDPGQQPQRQLDVESADTMTYAVVSPEHDLLLLDPSLCDGGSLHDGSLSGSHQEHHLPSLDDRHGGFVGGSVGVHGEAEEHYPQKRQAQARLSRTGIDTNFEMGLDLDWIFPGGVYGQVLDGDL